jgi:hypothetical protein
MRQIVYIAKPAISKFLHRISHGQFLRVAEVPSTV